MWVRTRLIKLGEIKMVHNIPSPPRRASFSGSSYSSSIGSPPSPHSSVSSPSPSLASFQFRDIRSLLTEGIPLSSSNRLNKTQFELVRQRLNDTIVPMYLNTLMHSKQNQAQAVSVLQTLLNQSNFN